MITALLTHLSYAAVFYRVVQAIFASGLSAMKYTVVAGVLEGNGLTVIANTGDPAGQAILARIFPGGIAPLGVQQS